MPRRVLSLTLLLAVELGCPHAWGRGGTIEMALRKDMTDYYSEPRCNFSERQWRELCQGFKHKSPAEKKKCPKECQPTEED